MWVTTLTSELVIDFKSGPIPLSHGRGSGGDEPVKNFRPRPPGIECNEIGVSGLNQSDTACCLQLAMAWYSGWHWQDSVVSYRQCRVWENKHGEIESG